MTRSSDLPTIHLRGARENNLTGVDVDLPHGEWLAITGPSGSGKSSLVFDTLVREGERRFLGSLSARARQFFGKLGHSDVDRLSGLPATIAVGQKSARANARSTVGTLTGTLDLWRLVFAREAVDPGGASLTRSHFSFNHPVGQCEDCRGLGLEDQIDPKKIVADPSKSIRDGALVPTLKSGYTVYSQVTIDVMDQICRAHGFDVDTPWNSLSDVHRDVIFHGTRALKVPFGKHSIESRMKWEGITARPREEGYYLGLVPTMEETLRRNRNDNILRFVTSKPCANCGGTRLASAGRDASLGGLRLPQILSWPAASLAESIGQLPDGEVWRRVRPAIEQRVARLVRLGLGHLSLDRTSMSLSGGEAQRVRLAAQLGAGLSGVLFALDEPTLGLHPESQEGMRDVLDELVEAGNSLIVVEHDPDMVRHADHVVALGPGAGTEGGEIVSTDLEGHPKTEERSQDPLGGMLSPRSETRSPSGELVLTGATLHNLEHANLKLGIGVFNVIMGPSGAGKSSLVFGTLLPALDHSSDCGKFETLSFDSAGAKGTSIQAVDARPIGKTPRSTPATWCGLFDLIRKRFAKLPAALDLGFTASHFSFNSARGRCPECSGLGCTRLGLHLFEDVELTCSVCSGRRFREEILAVELNGKNIADVLSMTFATAREFFADDRAAADLCGGMVDLGLGYLTLGQSSGLLSRGEAQRVKLGTLLGSRRKTRTIVLLDEPDRGLSPTDIAALINALNKLADSGHTVVAISHHRHVWASADRLIEVRGGRTNHEPEVSWGPISERRPLRQPDESRSPHEIESRGIELRGVETHNLRGVDVAFPRGRLTAVCGVSGSGKSSLVFATLAAEAQVRFAESLPFQVRQFMKRMPEPKLASAKGLTPTLNLRQGLGQVSGRSTISTQSECGPILRLLFSRAGLLDGEPCGLSAEHFSRERALGACPDCSGVGLQQRCDPARLVTAPERPIAGDGAMAGTRAGRFFTEEDSQYIATLAAALRHAGHEGIDLSKAPWSSLPPEAQQVALYGTGRVEHKVEWTFASKAEGEGRHSFTATWDGLCALVEREARSRSRSKKASEWAAALGDAPCERCEGEGLSEDARRTRVCGETLSTIEGIPLRDVLSKLTNAELDKSAVPARAAFDTLLPELSDRLDELLGLGLGHLSLGRRATDLSTGELQRVRLASVLRSGLSGVTLVLDEPTVGLHEQDVEALLSRLRVFLDDGNTVVVVSHRPSVLRAADHLIELGPGAGDEGGVVVAEGSPSEVLAGDSATAVALAKTRTPNSGAPSTERIRLSGVRVGHLGGRNFDLPMSGFVCVTGTSGSGKTRLTFDVLASSIRDRRPVGCDSIEIPGGLGYYVSVHDVRARRRSGTVLSALDLTKDVAALFHDPELPARAFKVGDAAGRCPACRGTGRERVALDFLADLDLQCQSCGGSRFQPAVLHVKWRGGNVAEWLEQPAAAWLKELESLPPSKRSKTHAKLCATLQALDDVAASHLALGRLNSELSGGEAARITLASNLLLSESPALYVFDEPSAGLHENDLDHVVAAFRRLAERGDLVVATEHRESVVSAADEVITC